MIPMSTNIPGRPPIQFNYYDPRFAEYYPYCEMASKAWWVENARPDWVILDCGANIGYNTILFSQLAANGHVHAFEPTDRLGVLMANLSDNETHNTTVHNIRLIGPNGETGADTMTIDAFVERQGIARLDAIKIDVDTFDIEQVLRGAEATLRRFSPYIVIDSTNAPYPRPFRDSPALQWLFRQGFVRGLTLEDENYVMANENRTVAVPSLPTSASAYRAATELSLPEGDAEAAGQETASEETPAYLIGLPKEEIAACRQTPVRQVFAVVTWGCSASHWLSAMLNTHPDIFCVHDANSLWRRLGRAPQLNGTEYLRIIGLQGVACAAAGDVHGVGLHTLPQLRQDFGDHFQAAVVVREPLPRLRSQLALYGNNSWTGHWDIEYVYKFIRQGVRLPADTYENRLVLHAIANLNCIIAEHAAAQVWRTEDLTADGEKLGAFIDHITRGAVRPDTAWTSNAVARPKLTSHTSRRPSDEAFEDWQIDAIRRIVHPRAWDLYAELGYTRPAFL